MTFEEFLGNKSRNAWVKAEGLSLYVRKSKRYGMDCIDLASITAVVRGAGALTRFLDRYESEHNFYVESILESRLVPYLEKRGYRVVGDSLSINMIRKAGHDTAREKVCEDRDNDKRPRSLL